MENNSDGKVKTRFTVDGKHVEARTSKIKFLQPGEPGGQSNCHSLRTDGVRVFFDDKLEWDAAKEFLFPDSDGNGSGIDMHVGTRSSTRVPSRKRKTKTEE